MIVTIFRATLRDDASLEELEKLAGRMYELASQMPGFVSYNQFEADGESLALIEFETLEDVKGWRDQPEHQEAQERGRNEFFSSYRIQVCNTERDYSFDGTTRTTLI